MAAVGVSSAVRGCNELTARWCAGEPGDRDFVVSGAGLWPLLALLASAAAGQARDELTAVTGVPADDAQREALDVLDTMDRATAASAALALWLGRDLRIADRRWADALPAGVVGTLDGQAELDAWAAEHTAGLIERFPLQIDPFANLVLATALGVKTRWHEVFRPTEHTPAAGPWQGRRITALRRTTGGTGAVSLLPGPVPVTRAVVAGVDYVDVHLLLGPPDSAAGEVIATGVAALGRPDEARSAATLPVGFADGGLRVTEVRAGHDQLSITVPGFTVRSSHDLCAQPDRFGLRTAMDRHADAFPTLHPHLFVSQGAQDVMATFSETGFEAAAVSTVVMLVSGVMRQPDRVRLVDLVIDRPFGFVAVHRETGLAIVAGWIATPG